MKYYNLFQKTLAFSALIVICVSFSVFFIPPAFAQTEVETNDSVEEDQEEVSTEYKIEEFKGDNIEPVKTGDKIYVESSFLSFLEEMDKKAGELNVTIVVTNSYRKSNSDIKGKIVPPAKKSNHLVGHAIDMNIKLESGNLCNSSCLQYKLGEEKNKAAKDFIEFIKTHSKLRWGGTFPTPDVVHIDDNLNSDKKLWDDMYKALRGGDVGNPDVNNTPIVLGAPIPIGEEGVIIEANDKTLFYVYVLKIYRWIAGIVGAFAVLIIMAGGFQIAIARGDTGMADEGKNRIGQAVIGLAFLFLSSILLRTINPAFYTFDEDIVINPKPQAEGFASQNSAGEFEYRDLKIESILDGTYKDAIAQSAQESRVKREIIAAILGQETNAKPDLVSSAGAVGIGQFMPDTARTYGLKVPAEFTNNNVVCVKGNENACKPAEDERYNAEKSIMAVGKFIAAIKTEVIKYKSPNPPKFMKTIASYNAGIGSNNDSSDCLNTTRWACSENPGGYLETQNYVRNIVTNLCRYSGFDSKLKSAACTTEWNVEE